MSRKPRLPKRAKHETVVIVLTPEYDSPEERERIHEICKRYGSTPTFVLETRYKMKMIRGPTKILEEARSIRTKRPRKAK